MIHGQLVSVLTKDDLRLRGLFVPPTNKDTVVVHVHGNSGNFYENVFLDTVTEEFCKAGIGLLLLNNRGHDVIAEAYRGGRVCYIGSASERYSECVLDLDAAIQFARQYASTVYLQGHSFGCLKVIHFLLNVPSPPDVILLSPADTIQLQRDFIQPELLEHQLARVRQAYANKLTQMLALNEFGIREQNCVYSIPITAGSFLELFQSGFARDLSYTESSDYHLDVAAFVYCGGADPLLTSSLDSIREYFLHRYRNVTFHVEGTGNHHMNGVETIVARRIVSWLMDRT